MPNFKVSTISTQDVTVAAAEGQSLMEALRDGGFEDIQAFCSGSCSCATCHVIIDADWFAKLPPVSEEESDLLDSIEGASPPRAWLVKFRSAALLRAWRSWCLQPPEVRGAALSIPARGWSLSRRSVTCRDCGGDLNPLTAMLSPRRPSSRTVTIRS
jgi:2Fe-2S ferredoxin